MPAAVMGMPEAPHPLASFTLSSGVVSLVIEAVPVTEASTAGIKMATSILTWPPHQAMENIYIYIYSYSANGSVHIANGSARVSNFAGSVAPVPKNNFVDPTAWDVKTDAAKSIATPVPHLPLTKTN
jgi:hypothetical protein